MVVWTLFLIIVNLITISLVMHQSIKQGMLSHPYLFHWVIVGVVGWVGVIIRIFFVGL